MSLDWNTEKCAKPLPDTDDEAKMRTSLIWATTVLDLGSITEDNVDEWVFRLFHQKHINIGIFHLADDVTPREVEGWVRRWIGLSCNVRSLPRKQWLKRWCEIMEKRTVQHLQYYKKREEVPVPEAEEK